MGVRSLWFKILWLAITYILWGSVFYTAINIPYGSMASAISEEPQDRQSLSTFRSMGGTLAGVIIGGGIPLIVYDKVNVGGTLVTMLNGYRFTVIAGILSLLAVAAYIACYFLTTERALPKHDERLVRSNSVGVLLKNALHN